MRNCHCIETSNEDMFTALKYIHSSRKYIHNDIKPDNIVIEVGSETKPAHFQLIDFGLLRKITDIKKPMPREGGTPIFYVNTIYEKLTNIFYDWHCILLSVLMMLGFNIETNVYSVNEIQFGKSLADYFKELIKIGGVGYDATLETDITRLIQIMVYNFKLYEATIRMAKGKTISLTKIIGGFEKLIFPPTA